MRVLFILLLFLLNAGVSLQVWAKFDDPFRNKVVHLIQQLSKMEDKEVPDLCKKLKRLGPKTIPIIAEFARSNPQNDQNPAFKHFLVGFLTTLDKPETDRVMIDFLSDENAYTRGLAVMYLAKRKHKPAIPHIVKLLHDTSVFITLTSPPPPQVINVTVQDRAVEALERITNKRFGTADNREDQVKEWLAWWKTQAQR